MPISLNNRKKYVAIGGNIGAGKSSLTRLLSDHFKWEAYYEPVEGNPYLIDFYHDMRRWSFNLQVYFLSRRFRHQQTIEALPHSVVQDRSIYEDAEVFARNLHEMGLMSRRDYENYESLFGAMEQHVRPPDLLVYLRASVPSLVRHIQLRGRPFESSIRIEYLERLNLLYEEWFESYDRGAKMVMEMDAVDFVNAHGDLDQVVAHVESRVFGLYPEL